MEGLESYTPKNDFPCLICYADFDYDPESCGGEQYSAPVAHSGLQIQQSSNPTLTSDSNVSNSKFKVSSTSNSKEWFDIFCHYMNLVIDVDVDLSSSSVGSNRILDLTSEQEPEPKLMDNDNLSLPLNIPFCKTCACSLQDLLAYHEQIQKLVILTKRITATLTMKIVESCDSNIKNRNNFEEFMDMGRIGYNPTNNINGDFKTENTEVYLTQKQKLWEKISGVRQLIYDRYDAKVHVSYLSNESQSQPQDCDYDSSDGHDRNLLENSENSFNSPEHLNDIYIDYDSDVSVTYIPTVEYGSSTLNSPSEPLPFSPIPSQSHPTFPNNDDDYDDHDDNEEIHLDSSNNHNQDHNQDPSGLVEYPSRPKMRRVARTRTKVTTTKLEPPSNDNYDFKNDEGKKSVEEQNQNKSNRKYAPQGCNLSLEEVSPGEFLYAGKIRFFQMKDDDGFRCGTCFVQKTVKQQMMTHCYNAHYRSRKIPLKSVNKMVEISPNMFLYANKYFVQKVNDKFKCCLCGKCLLKKYKLLQHIRVTHIRANGETSTSTSENKDCIATVVSLLETKLEANIKPRVQVDSENKEVLPNRTFEINEIIPIPIPALSSNSKRKKCKVEVEPSKEMDLYSDSGDDDDDDVAEINQDQGGKRYVEIEPNKFLYDKQYIFEKIDFGGEYKCCSCGFQDKRIQKMCRHLKLSHIKPRKTTIIQNKWEEVGPDKYLYAHKYTVEIIGGRFKCCTCEYTTKGKYKMFEHLRTKHLNPVEGYVCDNCGKQFQRKDYLNYHKKFSCVGMGF